MSALYVRLFVPKQYLGKKLMLRLENVKNTAEVTLNGQHLGIRAWSPFEFELTEVVKESDNVLEIEVRNTAENLFSTKPEISGLLDKVLIIPVK